MGTDKRNQEYDEFHHLDRDDGPDQGDVDGAVEPIHPDDDFFVKGKKRKKKTIASRSRVKNTLRG